MGKDQFKEIERSDSKRRARYTLEYKLEAVRLVKAGPGGSSDGQDTWHPQADPGELGALGPQGSAQGSRGQAGESGTNGAGQAAH